MDTKWVRIFKTTELYQAKILEALLKENEIACHLMNKQDSALVFGYIEIHVPEVFETQARTIIEENKEEFES